MTCIWCRSSGNPASLEHVIPDAFDAPETLVLANGEVCRPCNERLAYLDRAVADQFDLFRFFGGARRKRGRPPKVTGRPNLVAEFTPEGPVVSINMTTKPVRDGERVIGPLRKDPRSVRADFTADGGIVRGSIPVEFPDDPRVRRGLHKIALEALAYYQGAAAALATTYHPIRAFVVDGQGDRTVVWGPSGDGQYRSDVTPPRVHGDRGVVAVFRLALFDFYVDLTPGQSLVPEIIDRLDASVGRGRYVVFPPRTSPPGHG